MERQAQQMWKPRSPVGRQYACPTAHVGLQCWRSWSDRGVTVHRVQLPNDEVLQLSEATRPRSWQRAFEMHLQPQVLECWKHRWMAAPAGGKSREGAGSDLQILQLLKCAWLNVGQQAWEAGGHDVEPE